jgi:hypothetical protein
MPRTSAPDRAWLSAEVSADLAERFKSRAAAADRTPTQHLRHLIREEVSSNGETPAAAPGLREDASGWARDERP